MRKDKYCVLYVDHASREDLIAKYEHTALPENMDRTEILDPDIVWDGTVPLGEVTAERNLDFCISSHVIEHVPDVVGWLIQICTILRPGAIVNMAIPHRDRTFDFRRQVTRPSELIQAYVEKRTRPNGAQVFDQVSLAVPFGSEEPLVRPAAILEAYKHAVRVSVLKEYMDVHCSVFTPESFLRCFEVLCYSGLLNLRLRNIWPETSQGNEFVVSMEYGGFALHDMANSFRRGLSICSSGVSS